MLDVIRSLQEDTATIEAMSPSKVTTQVEVQTIEAIL